MRTISVLRHTLSAIVLSLASVGICHAQIVEKSAYVKDSREQREIQYMIDHSINYAENMLVRQGAYSPYAAVLTVQDSVINIYPTDAVKDQTLKKVIEDLKSTLRDGANKDLYKAIVVYYDATITDPMNNQSTDAIAAFTEQINTNGAYTFYFPYKKTELKGLTHSRSFGNLSDNEIFTKVSK